jgi:hypothetical protein
VQNDTLQHAVDILFKGFWIKKKDGKYTPQSSIFKFAVGDDESEPELQWSTVQSEFASLPISLIPIKPKL